MNELFKAYSPTTILTSTDPWFSLGLPTCAGSWYTMNHWHQKLVVKQDSSATEEKKIITFVTTAVLEETKS